MRLSLATLLAAASSQAATNTWVNWTVPNEFNYTYSGEAGTFSYARTMTGTLALPGGGSVNVSFSGEITDYSQLNAWETTNKFDNASTYLSPAVTSTPTDGKYVALTGFSGRTNTLTFSAPVTNLIMAIGSLGGGQDAAYDFDRDFIILSRGDGGFGNQIIPLSRLDSSTVYGKEGNGVIQFTGSISSLSWTTPRKEVYSIFNVGASDTAGTEIANALWTGEAPNFAVPEPSTYGLGLAGLALGFAALRRRRAR